MTTLSVVDQALLQARLRQRTAARLTSYADDPVGFIEEALGETLWSKQRQIAEAVRDYRHVAVPSCHDSGKSFIAARIAAWWLASRPVGEAFVVTTAPTRTQVRAILWREIARAHRSGCLPGRLNQTEWYMPVGEGEELVAYGRKPSDWDEDAFQGIHARYVLAILDEAGGVPRSLYTAVETITTSEECRVLAIGNPDHPGTQFARVCRSPDWEVIPIDGLETPNFTDEPVPDALRGLLLSRVWVEERRRDWGEDDPQFIAKVRGQFPPRPAGAVYSVDPGIHQWVGALPPFKRFVGGIDIGGQNIHDHATAAILGGVTAPGARCGPDRLVRLACFKGPRPGRLRAAPALDGRLGTQSQATDHLAWGQDANAGSGTAQADGDADPPLTRRAWLRQRRHRPGAAAAQDRRPRQPRLVLHRRVSAVAGGSVCLPLVGGSRGPDAHRAEGADQAQ